MAARDRLVRALLRVAVLALVGGGSVAAAQDLPVPPLPVPVAPEICALSVLIVGEAPLGCPDDDDDDPAAAPTTTTPVIPAPPATAPPNPGAASPPPDPGTPAASRPASSEEATSPTRPPVAGPVTPVPGVAAAPALPSTGTIGPASLASVDGAAVSTGRRLLVGGAVIALGLYVGATSAPRRRAHANAD